MNTTKQTVIAALVILVLGVGGFILITSDGDADEGDATDTTQQVEPEASAETDQTEETDETDEADEVEASQELTIDMVNYQFSTETITASPGETITVNLTNSGGEHNFIIDELDVASQTITAGQTTSVSFTIPEDAAGQTYAFYCGISNHRALGMEGQLSVN